MSTQPHVCAAEPPACPLSRQRVFAAELQPDHVQHLHVVSHGSLHNLPLSLGAPSSLRVSQYPGLVYYWTVHGANAGAIVVDKERPLFAEVCAASDPAGEGLLQGLKPIPHVLTEENLVATCWGKVDRLFNQRQRGDNSPATITHIAWLILQSCPPTCRRQQLQQQESGLFHSAACLLGA